MRSRTITVFGAGYVGLVTGACLASAGHRVTILEVDDSKLEALWGGRVPFHEPGLNALIADTIASGNLAFEHTSDATEYGEFIFVAVGTPSDADGAADLRFVRAVVAEVATRATIGSTVVMKSTVPPGTGAALSKDLQGAGIGYVSNPEFLREGNAISDWFQTDRIVLGGQPDAVVAVAELYENIGAPILESDIASAELIKYASNAFLATKISFANEISCLCDAVGADVTTVTRGVGLDRRIGPAFLSAGIGYGGSCFPKDTRALDSLSSANGHEFHLLRAVIDVNAHQRMLPITALRDAIGDLRGSRIAVLGLAFKPNTDDVREAPSNDIVRSLLDEGAAVVSYDPVARLTWVADGYEQAPNLKDALRGARGAVVATEWDEFVSADWPRLVADMSEPRLVFDGRNCLPCDEIKAAGGRYIGVGRR